MCWHVPFSVFTEDTFKDIVYRIVAGEVLGTNINQNYIYLYIGHKRLDLNNCSFAIF